jgi:hypothetical protein
MNQAKEIRYSLGRNKYDNIPCQVVADDFEAFERKILCTRSTKKGETFFTSEFANGQHTDTEKYPEKCAYRLKKLALPRRFNPMDFDGFSTPAVYRDLVSFLQKYRGFGYETWSHTPSAPRARAVLELSRPITANESVRIGMMLEHEIMLAVGSGLIKFDQCVYQLEQPVYVAPEGASTFIFGGSVVDVDQMLGQYSQPPQPGLKIPRRPKLHTLDEVTASLM